MVVVASYNLKEIPNSVRSPRRWRWTVRAVAKFRLMLEEYPALGRLRDNIVRQAEAALVFELWGHCPSFTERIIAALD
jgi:hypothetical protein